MNLPEAAARCIAALERAGFAAYAVGGCVRDSLLGLTPQDYDLCTAATPEEIKAVFSGRRLVLAGEKHGTVAVAADGGLIEITTFRTEGGYRDSRHPDWVRFVPDIETDLLRRDFTVNAMAYSPTRGLADPWGGQADLRNRVLRAVGDPESRFTEDALRILRGVRFAVRYGLTPEPATEKAMNALAPRMDQLAPERVFSELCKLISLVSAEDLHRFAPILGQILPELQATFGFQQHSPYHAYDLFTHIAQVTAHVPAELPLRLAALLHDIGKVPAFTMDENGRGHFKGHAQMGADMADAILLRLKAPTALRERVVKLIAHHMTPLQPDKRLLRRRLSQHGEEFVRQLLLLQTADFSSKGVGDPEEAAVFSRIAAVLEEVLAENACLTLHDLAVSGRDLLALGFQPGRSLGDCLDRLLLLVQDEAVPNTREALLRQAQCLLADE